ncbi:hypothetical protein NVV43_25475, partial [Escherichia marmotae]|nr:hypothetical protein [Escherichia marmotae]
MLGVDSLGITGGPRPRLHQDLEPGLEERLEDGGTRATRVSPGEVSLTMPRITPTASAKDKPARRV